MHPEKSAPFAVATVLLRSEKGTLYRESMTEIADLDDSQSDLDWDAEPDEDPDGWERPSSHSPRS